MPVEEEQPIVRPPRGESGIFGAFGDRADR
jgi:hypothetical protein